VVNDTKVHQRAQRAQWLLQLGVVAAAVGLWSSWQQLQLIQDLARGAYVANAVVEASDARQQLIGFAQLGLGLVSAVVFLMWTSAVTRRLIELGVTSMRYAPKWSVWGFIIPIVNLFRPYQVMSELWKASEVVPGPDDSWSAEATPLVVNVWFAALIGENIVGRLASRTTFETIDQVMQAAWLTVLSDALGAFTALIALRLVAEIDSRLRVSERRLAEAPAPAAVAPAL